jgi:glutaredoxin-like protein
MWIMESTSQNNETIMVYGTKWCPDCYRTRRFLKKNEITYHEIDVDKDAEGLAFVRRVNQGHRIVPTVVFPDGTIYVEPPDSALAAKLGLSVA